MQKKRKVEWTGKLTEGMRDDLVCAFMQGAYWREEFFADKAQYGRWHR